jgi:cell division transport system permease protein
MIKKVGMIVKYNIFGYLIGEGFGNVFKNKKSTGASLMIMCATMIIFGIFLILTENINHFVAEVESAQGIQVFINNEATQEQIEEVEEKLRALDGVSTTEYVSKEDALTQMKDRFGDKKDLLAGYEENNIFPASYVVTLTDLSKSKEVQDQILTFDNIKKITSKDETVTTLINLANGIKIVTGVILILLIIISIFIIANTIKLTVHARRKEISIMKYVGATNGFIRWPFIVEGMIIGVFASAISIVLVGIAYSLLAEQMVNSQFMQVINMSLVTFSDMFNSIIFVYMLLGIGIGAIRKRYLNEKIFKSIKEKTCVKFYVLF